MLQFQYLAGQSLTQIEDGTAAKLREVHLLAHVLPHLVVGFDLLRVLQRYLFIFVFHLSIGHNHAVAVDFEVSLVGVHNHVEVLVAAEDLGKHIAETFLQHAHQRSTVDILGLLELLEGIDHTDLFFFIFLCCHSYLKLIMYLVYFT